MGRVSLSSLKMVIFYWAKTFLIYNRKKVLLVAYNEVALQVYADTTKCMFVSCEQNVGQDDNIKAANNKWFKSQAKFTYLGTTLT